MNSSPFDTERDQNNYVYLHPKEAHETTLIFLHGLGDSAEGFADLWGGWNQHKLTPRTCRIVLPTAPQSKVSCNGGMKMNSWFDIYSLSSNVPATLAEVRKEFSQDELMVSANLLLGLVESEREKFADKNPGRIYIGGFS